ncbi:[protein release factor]-glutamine N5-methyltransferase [Polynucleobacter meluiroseus]|uniref:Release factor glutamine methyltransferase n=1 Tax=Polynucleobacter meluiroseus TaxID=1938814 RepID=A0A240E0Z3_9BURK|nr:peptide chain release factor N(5)-glutamine methyltransferase [Polynucleobacter meluiroseus]SNX28933.1 [protein release factor]-glutamine N5-methyltransferase [Polynucleobacter meluiroseus]
MSSDHSLRALLSSTVLPANEARILLGFILEKHCQLPRSALLSRDDMTLNLDALAEWQSLTFRRASGEPIAYLIGKKGFHAIELMVAPGVLIPRPETELLVDLALAEIESLKRPVSVLDLGTGSGAIALAIAHGAPQAALTATDLSVDALAIARDNADSLGLQGRVHFLHGSWYEPLELDAPFDIIVSNPPYIVAQDPHLSQGDLRFEPLTALTDAGSGLSCLEAIISGAAQYLKPEGLLAVEHGFDQSEAVVGLMQSSGFQAIQVHFDLAGHCRAVSGRKKS